MHPPASEESASQTRDVTINIRAKANQRALIDHAAQLQGKSRSEFMLESAYQKAQDVLLDRCFFGLDELKFKEFLALLDAPPTPNQKLNALLKTKSPWD
ncbi:type II toxin-antitoxin system TacA family antitoxin [Microcoleus sp. OTE_8_concoct_300]|uniref:type II toxin-antitoxin system TacA family antitoxin n=1 Tax=Microcoleus sp. OTE_8_concoct_300 TaxID=2964710 RepID=UPI00403F782E